MRRPKRSPRVATLCVLGKRAMKVSASPIRSRLLTHAAETIATTEGWHSLDALLLPGGYFRLGRFLGPLDFDDRKAALHTMPPVQAAIRAAKRLQKASPGCLVVFGADSWSPRRWEYGDQFCVAVGPSGVVGLSRKIILTERDSIHCRRVYVPYADDYKAPERFVRLSSGHRTVLCSCFDMFGICGQGSLLARRGRAIRDLHFDNSCPRIEERGFNLLREFRLTLWQRLLEQNQPSVAFAAIHDFRAPGRDGYWQRHGIAVASAAMQGLAVGAAHFALKLPPADSSTLCAFAVPRRALKQGAGRGAYRFMPAASLTIHFGRERALARLFAP